MNKVSSDKVIGFLALRMVTQNNYKMLPKNINESIRLCQIPQFLQRINYALDHHYIIKS